MPRTNLGQLLGNVDDSTPPTVAPAKPMVSAPTPPVAIEKPAPSPAEVDDPVAAATYLRFVRKDTRLREDQLEALTSHARRLNRKRRSAGPRVTENTLIRVAVDLLLDRIEVAVGDDEAALLKSVRR
jgi:hypothetical protein